LISFFGFRTCGFIFGFDADETFDISPVTQGTNIESPAVTTAVPVFTKAIIYIAHDRPAVIEIIENGIFLLTVFQIEMAVIVFSAAARVNNTAARTAAACFTDFAAGFGQILSFYFQSLTGTHAAAALIRHDFGALIRITEVFHTVSPGFIIDVLLLSVAVDIIFPPFRIHRTDNDYLWNGSTAFGVAFIENFFPLMNNSL
jgi:hypothetical protein